MSLCHEVSAACGADSAQCTVLSAVYCMWQQSQSLMCQLTAAHGCAHGLQGGLIAAIIMASLSRLGGNAHVAKRILRLLSTHLPGRVVLRLGAAKWQAQATGGEFATAVGSKASLQWAASRLWAAAEAVGVDPKLRSTNQEVAQLLEQVAALGEDTGESDLTPPSGPAPNRFAAAAVASMEAAGSVKASEAK